MFGDSGYNTDPIPHEGWLISATELVSARLAHRAVRPRVLYLLRGSFLLIPARPLHVMYFCVINSLCTRFFSPPPTLQTLSLPPPHPPAPPHSSLPCPSPLHQPLPPVFLDSTLSMENFINPIAFVAFRTVLLASCSKTVQITPLFQSVSTPLVSIPQTIQ